MRIGLAIHTPTYYEMNDQYSSKVYANFQEGYLETKSPDGRFSYQLTTPFKAIASLGLVINRKALSVLIMNMSTTVRQDSIQKTTIISVQRILIFQISLPVHPI